MSFHPDLLKTVAGLKKTLTITTGDTIANPERISTGSLGLDVALGGGWPTGTWSEIIGDPSSGKTSICLKTIAANQAKDPDFTVVWVAAENWFPEWTEKCGIDNSRVIVVQTNIMEAAYESVLQLCETKQVDLVVIDSLPALTPSSEDEKTMDEVTVGRGALLTNKFFRKIAVAQMREPGERQVAGILINQWRMKIGVMMGDPRTTPGGMGKDYAMSVRAEVKRDSWIEEGTGTAKRRIGQSIKLHTVKNKTFPPQQTAYVDFYVADGGDVDAGQYDFAKEIISLGLIHGIIDRRGGWLYYTHNGEDRKWQGAPNMLASVREEVFLADDLTKEVLDVLQLSAK
jgi:recombination protein RecA